MTSKHTIAACLIARDEAVRIGRCLKSVRPFVDEVCVYDTGSTDETVATVAEIAGEPGTLVRVERGEWRDSFSWAREQSFAMSDSAWLLWLDADDELRGSGALRNLVEAAVAANRQTILALYDSHDGGWVWRDRVTRRGAGRWEGRVHEFLRMPGPFHERSLVVHPGAFRVRHLRREQRPGRYLELIRLAAEEPERTPRAHYLLGKELMAIAAVDRTTAPLVEAAVALERYLERGDDCVEGDPNTYRGDALKRLTDIYDALGRHADYERVLRDALAYGHVLEKAVEDGRIPDATFFTELGDVARAWRASDGPPDQFLLNIDPFKGVKAGRNEACPCGSGKKFKKCHGAAA